MENDSTLGNETGNPDEYTGFKVQKIPYIVFIDIIVGLGLFGNLMNLVVMSTPSMRRFSFATYMICLSISDSIVLGTTAVEDNLDKIYDSLDSMLNVHISFCRFWYWIITVCLIFSPWTLAALTLDRFVTLILYRYRERICKLKVALIICVVIFSIAVIMVSPTVHTLEYIQEGDRVECNTNDRNMNTYFISLSVIMTSCLPVLIIICLNSITVGKLCRSIREDSSVDDVNIRKLSISLVLMSVLSAVALIPFSIVEMIEYIYIITDQDENWTQIISNLWRVFNVVRLLNYAMNFYVMLIFSSQFRQSLRGLCKCFSRRDQGLVTSCDDTATHTVDGTDFGMSDRGTNPAFIGNTKV